ncbi:hypothetical protein ERJ75_001551300 [Trypanosoma vivax]|nr:hypothetical protein ERJ75_001551300 [Trypanosoma vivax]
MGTRQRHGKALADEGARRDGSEEEREAEKVAGHGRTEEQIGTRSGGGNRRGWEKRTREQRTGTGLDWNESEHIEGTAQGVREKENTRDRK